MKDRIKKIQESLHLTQGAFASRIGSTPATITGIYSGRTNPTLNLVYQIVEHVHGINIGWLLYGTGEMYDSSKLPSTLSSTSDPVLSSEPEFEFSAFDDDDMTSSMPQNETEDTRHGNSGFDNDNNSESRLTPYASSKPGGQSAQSNPDVRSQDAHSTSSDVSRSNMTGNSVEPSAPSSINRSIRSTGQMQGHHNGYGQSGNSLQSPSMSGSNRQVSPSSSARQQAARYNAQQRQQPLDQESQGRIEISLPSEKNIDKPKRKITEIRIFFSDGTYETFEPKK